MWTTLCRQTLHCFEGFVNLSSQLQNYFACKKYHLPSVLVLVGSANNCSLVLKTDPLDTPIYPGLKYLELVTHKTSIRDIISINCIIQKPKLCVVDCSKQKVVKLYLYHQSLPYLKFQTTKNYCKSQSYIKFENFIILPLRKPIINIFQISLINWKNKVSSTFVRLSFINLVIL